MGGRVMGKQDFRVMEGRLRKGGKGCGSMVAEDEAYLVCYLREFGGAGE